MSLRLITRSQTLRACAGVRRLSLSVSASDQRALLEWKNQLKEAAPAIETLHRQHLSDLYITVPTRDGTHAQQPPLWQVKEPPQDGKPLPHGHHLVFFHSRNAERDLRPDRTDPDFCPPEPFTRRMWAGSEMSWVAKPDEGLLVGSPAVATSRVLDVRLTEARQGKPMVFVDQDIEYKSKNGPLAIKERRTHVYIPPARREQRAIRHVEGLPKPTFTFEFLPTPTTLFRFSALTFNAHLIHLDKHYAVDLEGYSERLVHGPLTALMLLEVAAMQKPDARFKHFGYRAHNPLAVNQPIVIKGAWENEECFQVWAESGVDGTVGMTGRISVYPSLQ